MTDKSQINAKELGAFLLEAKRNCWASGKKAEKLRTGAKRYIFVGNMHLYEDNYFEDDPNPFIGQETVFQNGKPIWGMNYYGKFSEEGMKYADQKGLMNFLREALMANDSIETPFRGPKVPNLSKSIIKDNLEYFNSVDLHRDSIFDFNGEERIVLGTSDIETIIIDDSLRYAKGKTLYQLNYHGGII